MKTGKPIVLYVIDTLATGGAEKSLLDISSGLTNFIPVVCVLFDKNPDLKQEFLKNGIELIELKVTSKLWWLQGASKLRQIIASVRPAIVHATLFKSEIITRIAMMRSPIPHIGSFVNDSYAVNRYQQQSFIRNMKLNVVRVADMLSARNVTHFMSISDSIARTNAKALLLDEKKITTIYRGRNIDSFPVSHPSVTQTPFIFLTVARLMRRKGYMELFEACKKLVINGFDFKVRIAGDGNDFEYFVNAVSRLKIQDRVEFLKNRADVPELLASSHCFVFPSHYEGQGGSLVEAMLAAKPIVASDIEVFSEQITDGESGKLFKVFDAADLADKMEWVLKHYDEAVILGLKAREIAVRRFNIENTARLHEELYVRILKEASSN